MTEHTEKDVYKEAYKELKPIIEKQEKRRKTIVSHFGLIISLSIIFLSIILFAYNIGYCETYNIPTSVCSNDIVRFIPVALQLACVLGFLIIYVSKIMTDNVLKHHKFSLTRVIIGGFICLWIIFMNHFIYALGLWSLLISVLLPVLMEFIYLGYWRIINEEIEDNIIDNKSFEKEKRNIISRQIFPEYPVKIFAIILLLFVSITPAIGKLSSLANREYQLFVSNNNAYAVIVDYTDRVLAQPAKADKDSLTIDTSNYMYFSKDNIDFVWVIFKDVKIVSDKNTTIIYNLKEKIISNKK